MLSWILNRGLRYQIFHVIVIIWSYNPHVFIILNPASENARTVKAYIILISSDPCQWVSKTTWNIVDGTSIHGGLNSKIVQFLRKSYFLIQELKSTWFWNLFRRSIEKKFPWILAFEVCERVLYNKKGIEFFLSWNQFHEKNAFWLHYFFSHPWKSK